MPKSFAFNFFVLTVYVQHCPTVLLGCFFFLIDYCSSSSVGTVGKLVPCQYFFSILNLSFDVFWHVLFFLFSYN